MEPLFNAIVELLEAVCRRTGLNYFEINILIYTFFIPASWWAIVWFRLKKWGWLGFFHLFPMLIYLTERQHFKIFSENFYRKNTEVLLNLGGGTSGGYILISILIGVILPLIFYGLLFFGREKWLFGIYLFFLILNFGWYFWAMKS